MLLGIILFRKLKVNTPRNRTGQKRKFYYFAGVNRKVQPLAFRSVLGANIEV
jgi:hypothetical protein